MEGKEIIDPTEANKIIERISRNTTQARTSMKTKMRKKILLRQSLINSQKVMVTQRLSRSSTEATIHTELGLPREPKEATEITGKLTKTNNLLIIDTLIKDQVISFLNLYQVITMIEDKLKNKISSTHNIITIIITNRMHRITLISNSTLIVTSFNKCQDKTLEDLT